MNRFLGCPKALVAVNTVEDEKIERQRGDWKWGGMVVLCDYLSSTDHLP